MILIGIDPGLTGPVFKSRCRTRYVLVDIKAALVALCAPLAREGFPIKASVSTQETLATTGTSKAADPLKEGHQGANRQGGHNFSHHRVLGRAANTQDDSADTEQKPQREPLQSAVHRFADCHGLNHSALERLS